VRSFRGGGGKWQISTDGATDPVWRRDGRALLYREAGHLMEAAIDTKSGVVVNGVSGCRRRSVRFRQRLEHRRRA
jgi:hypothetical protein